MSEPFLAEIRIVGFNFAPRGWAFCDGQILPINQNQALYSLLGTTYGGDGRTTFALPDLRGRAPLHVSSQYREGHKGGSEAVTLTQGQMPGHSHTAQASSDAASTPVPTGNVLANSAPPAFYGDASNLVAFQGGTISTVGGGQGHNNMQPFLALNFCIALQGLFPSRN